MDHIYVISVLFLLCFHARLFVDALWSPAWKGLISWLSFVMSNCNVVTFPLVSWAMRGASLYRFLIFALFLTLKMFNYMSAKNLHLLYGVIVRRFIIIIGSFLKIIWLLCMNYT